MSDYAYTEPQKLAISEALECLVSDSHFCYSKRFPSFLRFIIGEELAGRGGLLKERTLGVEVFGRAVGYDTTSDPIVRVTAAEIRKRLAQYYQDHSGQGAVQISLPTGSYVPHFEWPLPPGTPPGDIGDAASACEQPPTAEVSPSSWATIPVAPHAPDPLLPQQVAPAKSPTRHWNWLMGGVLILLLATATLVLQYWRANTLDRFWAPVLQPDSTVVVCFPRYQVDTMYLRNASDPERVTKLSERTQAVNVDDLGPLVSLTGLLQRRGQRFLLIGQDSANLSDLRRGPDVLIGAFNNAWVLRATSGLRYRFGNDPDMQQFWIEDTQGTHRRWQVNRTQQVATDNYRDYAIVARFTDSSTGQVTVVSAGVARGGTMAAGEFLTEPADMARILKGAPKHWSEKNLEVVLSTDIIDGKSTPPKIEATYFW